MFIHLLGNKIRWYFFLCHLIWRFRGIFINEAVNVYSKYLHFMWIMIFIKQIFGKNYFLKILNSSSHIRLKYFFSFGFRSYIISLLFWRWSCTICPRGFCICQLSYARDHGFRSGSGATFPLPLIINPSLAEFLLRLLFFFWSIT